MTTSEESVNRPLLSRPIKLAGLVVGAVIALVVLFQLTVFGRRAGRAVLATLESGQRTALINEQIAADLATATLGARIVSIDTSLKSVLDETTSTIQALRPALAETTATARAARQALEETAATAKAARVAIENAKAPDLDPVLRRTDALLEETTRLVHETNATAPQTLAATQKLVDRLSTLVTDSDLTATLRTTGRIAANIEHDQGNVSAIIANTVPVSEAVKNTTAGIERKVGALRRFFRAIGSLF
jgi:hypothetical protein